jgi:hypothetical protein
LVDVCCGTGTIGICAAALLSKNKNIQQQTSSSSASSLLAPTPTTKRLKEVKDREQQEVAWC